MFKDFDRIAQETKNKQKSAAPGQAKPDGNGGAEDPLAKLFAGLSG
jgi:hypothetical protein